MTKKIQPLSPCVVKKLRSGVNLTTVAHCVEELVLNSIDANATCVAVNLNLPFYQIQVVDNGTGIELEQLKIIGTRYATSKCHTLEDLQNLRCGGFRGEALSSLKEMSSILMIESRFFASSETFCKIFTQGKSATPEKSLNSRPSKGTTVSVFDFMYNMPVRKKCISDALDLEECRKLLQGIALSHPNISFSLKNEVNGEMCLQLKKCSSLYHSFIQIFGKHKAKNLKDIHFSKDEYEISGCISTECHMSKDLQFLYVNKRQIYKTKLHKLINNILNKALNVKQKPNLDLNKYSPDTSSPSKSQTQYCIFVLNISCPYNDYDVLFEPRKTVIEFCDWDKVLKMFEDMLFDFLKKERIVYGNLETDFHGCDLKIPDEKASSFDMHDCTQGMFSNVVKRHINVLEMHHNVSINTSDKNSVEMVNINNQVNASSSISSGEIKNNLQNITKNTTSNEQTAIHCSGNSVTSLKSNKTSASLLDDLKTSMTNLLPNKNPVNSSNSESKTGIPCRSVFPSNSPVMLRIPIKSTLSDLGKSNSSELLIKLKEKFQFSPKKSKEHPTKQQVLSKHVNKNIGKASFRINDSHSSCKTKNSQPLLDVKKNETEKHTINKRYDKVENVCNNNFSKTVKSTNDKSFQFPSVPEISTKVISRFEFRKESTPLFFQHFQKSSRLQRKSVMKDLNESSTSSVENYYNVDTNNDISNPKRLKSLHLDISEKNINDLLEDYRTVKDNKKVRGIFSTKSFSKNKTDTFMKSFKNLPHDTNTNIDQKSEHFTINIVDDASGIKDNDKFNLPFLNNIYQSPLSLKTFSPKNNDTENVHRSPLFKDNIFLNSIFECDTPNTEHNVCNIYSEPLDSSFLNLTKQNHIKNNLDNSSAFLQNNSKSHMALGDINSSAQLKDPNIDNVKHLFDSTTNSQISENVVSENFKSSNTLEKPLSIEQNNNLDHNLNKTVVEDSCNLKHLSPSKHTDLIKNSNGDVLQELESFPFSEALLSNNSDVKQNNSFKNEINTDNLDNSKKYSADLEFSKFTYMDVDVLENTFPFTESLSSNVLQSKQNTKSNSNSESSIIHGFENLPQNLSLCEDFSMDVSNSTNDHSSSNIQNVETLVQENNFSDKDVEIRGVSEQYESNEDVTSIFVADSKIDEPSVTSANDGNTELKVKKENSENFAKTHSRWTLHSEPNTKRIVYIDRLTGNSTYVVPEENMNNKQGKCPQSDNIELMLSKWNNPTFEVPCEVSCVSDGITQNFSQMYTSFNSYRFSRNTLKSLQVIGQVDCKFIVCILRNFNEDLKDQKLLALFDQHAVHERIRLEKIMEDLYEVKDGEKFVKSSTIYPLLELTFGPEDIRLLEIYHKKLNKIGILLSVDNESHTCSISSIPECLVDRKTNELRRSRSDTTIILQNSITEWLSSLVKTRSIPQLLPKTLASVVNSKACRGAVKFGDPLSLEQCKDLLKSLSDCKLPFQCAHGRPSLAPILDLNKIESLYKKESAPQLFKILKQPS